jgi:RNA polymerase sigma-70 factor (ECF subfamily)
MVARAQGGDRSAAEEVIVACNELVVRLVRAHHLRSIADEDLAQEVFMTMLARLDRYRVHRGIPFRHWLSRLAVNVCVDRARSEARRTRALVPAETLGLVHWLCDGGAVAPDDALAAADAVEALLAGLPPQDRLVLTLMDLEGRTAQEIAEVTGWSQTLVRVRAFRARRRLRGVAKSIGLAPERGA